MERQKEVELEKIFKGVANHRRVQIIGILEREPQLSLSDVAERTKSDYKNIGEHLRKLVLSGLVTKHHKGATVLHELTKRGRIILKFCRTLV